MSKRKNETDLDLGAASDVRLGADTAAELKDLIAKLAASKDAVDALEQNELSTMLTFLETFQSDGVEEKFILHHLTRSVSEKNPESLLRWALVFMLRRSKNPRHDVLQEVLKLGRTKPH